MDASALGSLFPALKHMVGHKKSKAPVPEIQNLATTEANGLHIEISSLQDHLKSRLKVLEVRLAQRPFDRTRTELPGAIWPPPRARALIPLSRTEGPTHN
eukprot:1086071-Rhodomonas_salina.4